LTGVAMTAGHSGNGGVAQRDRVELGQVLEAGSHEFGLMQAFRSLRAKAEQRG